MRSSEFSAAFANGQSEGPPASGASNGGRFRIKSKSLKNLAEKFLQDSEEIPKLREDAKAAIAQRATNGLNSDQVAAIEKFLVDSEEILEQRAVLSEEVLLKFAMMRALLSGERGN